MKTVYDDALLDVKKVKEIAESNAQRAVLEAVAPRIRDLIENELFNDRAPSDDEHLLTDDDVNADAISMPDEEGKVTVDIDAVEADANASPVDSAYEVSDDSVESLGQLTGAATVNDVALEVYKLGDVVESLSSASPIISKSRGFFEKVSQTISEVNDMYGHVQGSLDEGKQKDNLAEKLEGYYKKLTALQENVKMKKNRRIMNEEDITLKLTGLPDDVDLESVGVDLVSGEGSDDGEGDEGGDDLGDLDLGGDEAGGDEGGDEDVLDLGGDEDSDDEGSDEVQAEADVMEMDDDTVVEIDESVLRREIMRAKRRMALREDKDMGPGGKPGPSEFDDFGGAKSKGEPLDMNLSESDEEDDEVKEMVELSDSGMVEGEDDDEVVEVSESTIRRLKFERRLQERARRRAAMLKLEARKARKAGNKRAFLEAARSYRHLVGRLAESKTRSRALFESVRRNNVISETRSSVRASRSNAVRENIAARRVARTQNNLRSKLSESNLINAKLTFLNKLLQNESLTGQQRKRITSRFDSIKTLGEARQVYNVLSKAIAQRGRAAMNESRTTGDRKVLGGSSRVMKPTATLQQEAASIQLDRWQQLAGLKK